MTNEERTDATKEIGLNIINWLRAMPDIEDLHKMIISIAAVSTTDNKATLTKEDFDSIAEWAQMVCQNLEMVALFQKGLLIARRGEDGEMEVDFSAEAAEIVEKARQSDNDN